MPNGLTGDFESVLQVSGGTLRRLLAAMHQNASADRSSPSLPHVTHFRMTDEAVPGERGAVAAQVGAPHLHLLHGATDRFRVEIPLRARYHADPGSAALADVIHGTIHAEYRLDAVDPRCWGWSDVADDYVWLRVVEDSVFFEGTVSNESSGVDVMSLLNEPAIKARVTRHLAWLLATRFAPTPQRLSPQFRRVRTLSFGDGPQQSAAVVPMGLDGAVPGGSLASVERLFIGARDIAVAVSREAVLARLQPMIDPMVGLQRDVHVRGDAGWAGGLSIDYHVRVTAAEAVWLGQGPFGLAQSAPGFLLVRVTGSGWASRLYRSGVYNVGSVHAADLGMGFAADQLVSVAFDPAVERFFVRAFGPPSVTVNYRGPFGSELGEAARDHLRTEMTSRVAGPLGQAETQLNAMVVPRVKAGLLEQLQRIDPVAGARLDELTFTADGMILRGQVRVGPRHRPVVSFTRTPAGDGFDAIESWVPGGRIDSFRWTWRWFTTPIQGAVAPGTAAREHSFLLHRPHAARSAFAYAFNRELPLPGLDGMGQLCLSVRGTCVDPVTGALVPVVGETECATFGFPFRLPYEVAPDVAVYDPLRVVDGIAAELGVVRVGTTAATGPAANTLVVYLDDAWSEAAAATVSAGLAATRRHGTGLVVLVLFREGALGAVATRLGGEMAEWAAALPVPVMAGEDLGRGWTNVLGLHQRDGAPLWRLLSPDGAVAWSHDGAAEPGLLARALDERLAPSGPPTFAEVRRDLDLSRLGALGPRERECPPAPLPRGAHGSMVTFVSPSRASSHDELLRIQSDVSSGGDPPVVIAIVAGAGDEEAETLRRELGLSFLVVADPRGEVTGAMGIEVLPTTVRCDERGLVVGHEIGVGGADPDRGSRPEEAERS